MSEPDNFRLPSEEPLPPRIDLRIAMFFIVLGCTIIGLSLRMPTGLDQKGAIYTAPGLVPGIYGFTIVGLSIWLGARAVGRMGRGESGVPLAIGDAAGNWRLIGAALLCVLYSVGLIGRLPFWMATVVFVTLFIALFEWESGLTARDRLRPLATALAQGLITGLLVTLVFEKIFYVRLP
jgi:Tripartite tricarboxylate transporter TctB family